MCFFAVAGLVVASLTARWRAAAGVTARVTPSVSVRASAPAHDACHGSDVIQHRGAGDDDDDVVVSSEAEGGWSGCCVVFVVSS